MVSTPDIEIKSGQTKHSSQPDFRKLVMLRNGVGCTKQNLRYANEFVVCHFPKQL